jgi:hypothetical protein
MGGTGEELYIYANFLARPKFGVWLEACDGIFDFTLSGQLNVQWTLDGAASGGYAGSHESFVANFYLFCNHNNLLEETARLHASMLTRHSTSATHFR